MKKNREYEINFATNSITVSRRLLDGATQMGTDAFETMRQLQEMDMPIVVETINRKPKNSKWSYARMEKYVEKVENADTWKAKYQTIKDTSTHGETWTWFRQNFIRVDKKGRRIPPSFTPDGKIVVPPVEKASSSNNITPISQKTPSNGAKTEPNVAIPATKGA